MPKTIAFISLLLAGGIIFFFQWAISYHFRHFSLPGDGAAERSMNLFRWVNVILIVVLLMIFLKI